VSAGTSVVVALAGFFLLIAALTVSRLLPRSRNTPTRSRRQVGGVRRSPPDG